jgi:transcriptional regulator with GAF, ATPase, and Fis domain
MLALYARLERVATSHGTVLIGGETGTGKELVAQALHDASGRADGPFVVVDCGALPETLLDAELFGHGRGAFTGAIGARAGAVEVAHGGTLFLDEIGELPLALQPKLLRVLEARTIRRLGENEQRAVDVRFVCATHRDLRAMVGAHAFREDLYFRLAVLPITVPALRERRSDVALLAQRFLPEDARALLTPELIAWLEASPWPGNVRELRNFIERLTTLGAAEALAMTAATALDPAAPAGELGVLAPELQALPFKEARERWMNQMERAYVAALLERHAKNMTAAAAAAGLDRTYLHRLRRKHRL